MQKISGWVKVSSHFPFEIRQRLVAASETPVTVWDPMARVRKIDAAVQWAKTRYPELFR